MNFFDWLLTPEYTLQTYQAAGCIFTDGKHVLGGYQPKGSYISGLGGKRIHGEDYHQTALRETVEELFDVVPSEELLYQLQNIPYSKHIMNGPYVALVFSFHDLKTFMDICKIYIKESILYAKFPETLEELIFNRLPREKTEVHNLYILPTRIDLHVDANFLTDFLYL